MTSITRTRLTDKVEVLDIANSSATARISLYGGQVLSYRPRLDDRERLYLSPSAHLDGSKSIRGGIPVCWPWFGAHADDPSCPAHGYVRNRQWHVVDEQQATDSTGITLQASDTHGSGFDADTELFLHVVIAESLQLGLLTRNTGAQPCRITCALHSYFAVPDISQTSLEGLSGQYADKVRDFALFETPSPYRFSAETDRIHLDASPRVSITGPGFTTGVVSSGHDSIVVWNPWTACNENFPDMPVGDYRHMLCVESAITQGLDLAPGGSHVLRQIVS